MEKTKPKLSTAKLITLSSLRAPYNFANPGRTLCQACGRWDGAPSLHQDIDGWTGEVLLLFGQRVNEEELRYLQNRLRAVGFSERGTLAVDAVRCVGKTPSVKQIRACRPFLVGLAQAQVHAGFRQRRLASRHERRDAQEDYPYTWKGVRISWPRNTKHDRLRDVLPRRSHGELRPWPASQRRSFAMPRSRTPKTTASSTTSSRAWLYRR